MGKPHFILRPKIHAPQLQWQEPEISSAETPNIYGLFFKMEVWLRDVWINLWIGFEDCCNVYRLCQHDFILSWIIFDVDGLEVCLWQVEDTSVDRHRHLWMLASCNVNPTAAKKCFLEYDGYLRHLVISWKQFGITASWLEAACCSNFMPIQVLLDLPVRITGSLTKWPLNWIQNYFAGMPLTSLMWLCSGPSWKSSLRSLFSWRRRYDVAQTCLSCMLTLKSVVESTISISHKVLMRNSACDLIEIRYLNASTSKET